MSDTNDEVKKLLKDLIESTNKTLASHKTALDRHEKDILAGFETAKTHAHAIKSLRGDIQELAAAAAESHKCFGEPPEHHPEPS